MKSLKVYLILLFACLFCSLQAEAVTLFIGDKDGFGYGDASGYLGVDGNPAERTGDRTVLDMGDVLPDVNRDGSARYGGADDFDYRSTAEKNDTGNSGLKWTDVSLSRSYDNGPGLADDAVFVFRFTPPAVGEADYGRVHYINLVYGDYDVEPMTIELDGKVVELLGTEVGGLDGFIWSAYATVSWNDVKDGEVVVNIRAEKEPYTAFDYIMLDVTTLVVPNPNPASMLNLLLGD